MLICDFFSPENIYSSILQILSSRKHSCYDNASQCDKSRYTDSDLSLSFRFLLLEQSPNFFKFLAIKADDDSPPKSDIFTSWIIFVFTKSPVIFCPELSSPMIIDSSNPVSSARYNRSIRHHLWGQYCSTYDLFKKCCSPVKILNKNGSKKTQSWATN